MSKIKFLALILASSMVLTACTHKPKTDQNPQQKIETAQAGSVFDGSERYVYYSPAIAVEAAKDDGVSLLFFHADWCPTCRAAEKDILGKLDQIPENLTIIKTNYDTEKDLKKKYGITYQHTFVQVDENGEMITKWAGGALKEIVERIK